MNFVRQEILSKIKNEQRDKYIEILSYHFLRKTREGTDLMFMCGVSGIYVQPVTCDWTFSAV